MDLGKLFKLPAPSFVRDKYWISIGPQKRELADRKLVESMEIIIILGSKT